MENVKRDRKMKLRQRRDEYQQVSLYNNLTIKFLAHRCDFFSGRVRSWHRCLRLCCVSDFIGNSSSSAWCLQCTTVVI